MALDAGLIDYALAITLNGLVRHTHNDKSKDKNTNKNQGSIKKPRGKLRGKGLSPMTIL